MLTTQYYEQLIQIVHLLYGILTTTMPNIRLVLHCLTNTKESIISTLLNASQLYKLQLLLQQIY